MKKDSLIALKLRISIVNALKVFNNPLYILLATAGSIFSSGFILWSLNLNVLGYILFDAPISLIQKIDFFFEVYAGIYTNYSSAQATGIVVFSVLFGINLALLVFVLKNRGFKNIPKKSGIGGFAFAIIGGGCIACGTSLLAPLVATLGAASTPFIRDIGTLFNWLGSILIIYSIYKLGAVCSYIFASQKH